MSICYRFSTSSLRFINSICIRSVWQNALTYNLHSSKTVISCRKEGRTIYQRHTRNFHGLRQSQYSSSSNSAPTSASTFQDRVKDLDREESYASLTPRPAIIPPEKSESEPVPNVPKTPFMTEDVRLSRVSITGYGAEHFDVHIPSALPQSATAVSDDISPTQAILPSPFGTNPKQSTSPLTTITSMFPAASDDWRKAPTSELSLTSSDNKTRTANATGSLFGKGIFGVSDSIAMKGSIIALPNLVLLWSPQTWAAVTLESLSFLSLLNPRPDIILFGTGARVQPLPSAIASYLSELHISYDIFSSSSAAATFNVLNEEDRFVVAAIVPMGELAEELTIAEAAQRRRMERPSYKLREKIEQRLESLNSPRKE